MRKPKKPQVETPDKKLEREMTRIYGRPCKAKKHYKTAKLKEGKKHG